MNTGPFRKLELFIRDLELKVEVVGQLPSRDGLGFANKTIFIDGWIWYILWNKNPKMYYIKQIVHELGHFLIAPKSRRYKKDYGIPKITWKDKNKNRDYWDLDEFKAQLVGFYLLQRFKLTKNKRVFLTGPDDLLQKAREWFKNVGKNKIDLILKSRKLD